GVEKMRARLEQLLPGAADDVSLPVEDVVIRTHEELAQAPSRIVVATVEDALLSEQRPNMPGTTQPSNWSTPLPGTLEDLEASPQRCVVDGEIVIAGAEGLEFESLQLRLHPAESRVRKLSAEIPASFVVFDLLALDDRDLRPLPFSERRALLEAALSGVEPP